MLKIKKAEISELAWVNKCYDEVGFIHSSFETEIIAIATIDEQPAGLGRLVLVDNENLELGGMYVFEPFRGQGIAKKIVEFLLQQPLCIQKTIYCIPFEDLIEFYKQFGFMPCINMQQAPKGLVKKLLWCREEYTKPTSLLILERLKPNYYKDPLCKRIIRFLTKNMRRLKKKVFFSKGLFRLLLPME